MKLNESLEKTIIISVSGTWNHCFAVSEEGKVFGFGSNESGKLGLGKEITKVNIFTEIKTLNKYKIKMAYASWSHSLFQTEEGKILACGSNLAGELLGNNLSSKCYYLPIETVINEGATFCFAGKGITGVFISCDPSMSPNRTISEEKLKSNDVNSFLKAENDRLNLLIKKMQDENKKLYKNDHHEKIELFEQKMIDKLKQVNVIYQGSQSEVVKVSYEQEFALKVLHTKTKSKMTSFL